MTARRQSSTTSLARFARAGSPDPAARSLDYCNNFWGVADGGVDVLFARMRGAARTMEEMRNFWKERALLEEDYAKRLAKLSKMVVGRDEIGDFRVSLDSLKAETEKQSSFHLNLAQQIRNDLEAPATAFVQRQIQHKRAAQAAIEKQFKNKQAQEQHVVKAREKYEQDCLRINAYTAQSSLAQGKELERLTIKLEHAQRTVHGNEREFANFARALQDSTAAWEREWKTFCDGCQDMEDDRMEFTKDNVWAYANAVSIVCVSDDESCERLRLALEQFEPERDQENFVASYATGSQIPDPPQFVNYASPDGVPSSSQRTTMRPAQFQRESLRTNRPTPSAPQPVDDEPSDNVAGVGAAKRVSMIEAPPQSPPRAQSRTSAYAAEPNGMSSPMPANQALPRNSTGGAGSGSAVDPTTMLVVGSKAYPVDPSQNPQGSAGSRGALATATQNIGDISDPIERARQELMQGAGVGRNPTTRKGTLEGPPPPQNLAAPGAGGRNRDYRQSGEFVVGGPPPGNAGNSRPASPAAPQSSGITNAHMRPVGSAAPQGQGQDVVRSVLDGYGQSFPGERSRPGSRRNSFAEPVGTGMSASMGSQLERPSSRSFAGVGAQGRSPSPGLAGPPRAAPVNGSGIRLDPQGRVVDDQLPPQSAGSYAGSQLGTPAGQQVARRPSVSNSPGGYGAPPGSSPVRGYPGYGAPQGQQQQQLQNIPPPPQGYGAPPGGYAPPPPAQHPYAAGYGAPPPQQQQQQPSGFGGAPRRENTIGANGYGAPQQPQQQYGHAAYPSAPALQGGYYGQQPPQQQPGYGPPQGQGGYGGQQQQQYGARGRSPSPQPPPLALTQGGQQGMNGQVPPTRQYTEDGRGVLFYVKALYDYSATIPEEFDFQQGDIIAVTNTPEDGWWSGELLDEARRVPGRHIFPSNFVHLF